MKRAPLIAYLVLVALLSAGFIAGMKAMGRSGNYLAGAYMLGPAIAAALTRLFFYRPGFRDARLHFGRWPDYLRFWGITLGVVVLSYAVYTLLGAIRWDFSGDTFLAQLQSQLAASGERMDDLPAGFTPQLMLIIFFIGGLTVFNIPMVIAGFGEEFGWRGFMFPLLCRSRRVAGFVIGGLIWFAWHVPAMFVLPDTSAFTPWQYALGAIVLGAGSIGICVSSRGPTPNQEEPSWWHRLFTPCSTTARGRSHTSSPSEQLLANIGLMLTMLAVVAVLRAGSGACLTSFLPGRTTRLDSDDRPIFSRRQRAAI